MITLRGISQNGMCWRLLFRFYYSAYFSGGVLGAYTFVGPYLRPFGSFRKTDLIHVYSIHVMDHELEIILRFESLSLFGGGRQRKNV